MNKLFTVTLLGLAAATTLVLTGCKPAEEAPAPETPEVQAEAPAVPEGVSTTETTAAPAEEAPVEEAPAEGEAAAPAGDHH